MTEHTVLLKDNSIDRERAAELLFKGHFLTAPLVWYPDANAEFTKPSDDCIDFEATEDLFKRLIDSKDFKHGPLRFPECGISINIWYETTEVDPSWVVTWEEAKRKREEAIAYTKRMAERARNGEYEEEDEGENP